MKTVKTVPYSVPPVLQKAFVYSAFAAFAVPAFYQVYQAVMQYASNPNLSSYYWVAAYMLVAPILFFVLAYLLSDRRKPVFSRIFVSTLMSVVGMMVLIALDTFVNQVVMITLRVFSDAFWDWFIFELELVAATLGAYTLFLLALKRSGKF